MVPYDFDPPVPLNAYNLNTSFGQVVTNEPDITVEPGIVEEYISVLMLEVVKVPVPLSLLDEPNV